MKVEILSKTDEGLDLYILSEIRIPPPEEYVRLAENILAVGTVNLTWEEAIARYAKRYSIYSILVGTSNVPDEGLLAFSRSFLNSTPSEQPKIEIAGQAIPQLPTFTAYFGITTDHGNVRGRSYERMPRLKRMNTFLRIGRRLSRFLAESWALEQAFNAPAFKEVNDV